MSKATSIADLKQNQAAAILDEALSEHGIVAFSAIDSGLVNVLSEIIGAMHRELEARGMSSAEISAMVKSNF